MLTIEEWYGPFDKPRTMLTERDSSGNFLRRFDLTGFEYIEVRTGSFGVKPLELGIATIHSVKVVD